MGNTSRKAQKSAGQVTASDQFPDSSIDGNSSFFSVKSSLEDAPLHNGGDFIIEHVIGQVESPQQLNVCNLHASFLAQFVHPTKIDDRSEPLPLYEIVKSHLWSIHSLEYVTMCALNILSILEVYAGCVPKDSDLTNQKAQIMHHVLDKLYNQISQMKSELFWHSGDGSLCQSCHGCDVKKIVLKHIVLRNGCAEDTFCLICLDFFPKGNFAEHCQTTKHENVKQRLINGMYPYSCSDCEQRFVSLTVLEQHRVRRHLPSVKNIDALGDGNLKFTPVCCYLCWIPFSDTNQLKEHELRSLEHGFRKEVAMEVALRNLYACCEERQSSSDVSTIISASPINVFSELIHYSKLENPPESVFSRDGEDKGEDVKSKTITEFYYCNVCRAKVPRAGVIVHERGRQHRTNCEKWVSTTEKCIQPFKGQTCDLESNVCNEASSDLTGIVLNNSGTISGNYCMNQNNHAPSTDCEKSAYLIETKQSGNLSSKPSIQQRVPSAIDFTECDKDSAKESCITTVANSVDVCEDLPILIKPENDAQYHCSPCNVRVPKSNIVSHENGQKHKFNREKWVASYSKKNQAVVKKSVNHTTGVITEESMPSASSSKLPTQDPVLEKIYLPDDLCEKSGGNSVTLSNVSVDLSYKPFQSGFGNNEPEICATLVSDELVMKKVHEFLALERPLVYKQSVDSAEYYVCGLCFFNLKATVMINHVTGRGHLNKVKSIHKSTYVKKLDLLRYLMSIRLQKWDILKGLHPDTDKKFVKFSSHIKRFSTSSEEGVISQPETIIIGNKSGTTLQEEFHRICSDGDVSDYEIQCGTCGVCFQVYNWNGEEDINFSYDMHVQNDPQHLLAAAVPVDRNPQSMAESATTNCLLTKHYPSRKGLLPVASSSNETSGYCLSTSDVTPRIEVSASSADEVSTSTSMGSDRFCKYCHRNLNNYQQKTRRQHERHCKMKASGNFVRSKSTARDGACLAQPLSSVLPHAKSKNELYYFCKVCSRSMALCFKEAHELGKNHKQNMKPQS